MSKTITVMVPLRGNLEYYNMYRKQFWDMIKRETFDPEAGDITIYFGICSEDPHDEIIKELLLDWEKAGNESCCKFLFDNFDDQGPCRGSILINAFGKTNSDYFLFVDFDDILDKEYFKIFWNTESGEDQIIGKGMRYKDGVKIPKDYLVWRPKGAEDLNEFFSSSNYGNCVWNRFLNRRLVKRVVEKIKEYGVGNFDNHGFGEEYCIHHLIFTNTNTFGFCDSTYLWNYGNLTSQSKNIDVKQATLNIVNSLGYLPEPIREKNKERYFNLMCACIDSIK